MLTGSNFHCQHQQTRRNQYQQGATNNGEAFDEEFDFNAGLQSFDKSAVFAHIRSTDNIDPSLRLVAHNRKDSSRTPQSKLLPSESVLTVEELETQQLDRKVALEEAAVPKQQPKRGMTVEELEAGIASVGLEQEQDRGYEYPNEQSGTLMTETGIVVPSVKARQWREALNIADVRLLVQKPTALTDRLASLRSFPSDRNFAITRATPRIRRLPAIDVHLESPRTQVWLVPYSIAASISSRRSADLHGLREVERRTPRWYHSRESGLPSRCSR